MLTKRKTFNLYVVMENDRSQKKEGRFISVYRCDCFENEERLSLFIYFIFCKRRKKKNTDEIISARNRAVTRMRF